MVVIYRSTSWQSQGLFKTERLSEISSNKGDRVPMTNNHSIRGGGETRSALQDLGSTGGAVVQSFDDWVRGNPETMDRWREALLAIKAEFIDDLAAQDGSDVRALLFNPEDLRKVMQHGWYPPPDIALAQLRLWAGGFGDPDEERAESARQIGFMVFRRDANKIKRTLAEQFPHRKQALSEAFDAHQHGRYFSSVALLLTQADGICHDAIGENICSRKTIASADSLADDVQEGILRELFRGLMWEGWPLALSRNNRPSGLSELNRHQVLHGESTDYGTEENSLKAISFLNFCGFVFKESRGSGE